ncbi:MAG: hypothetical protein J0H76_06500 [Sphingobacteriales bacterium]|nr:hypothetical protein [Sphingobacteriales bacterium]
MKLNNSVFILFISFLLMSASAKSQHSLDDGTLLYNISIHSSNQESKTIPGATLTLYVSKTKSSSVMNSALGTESAVYDNVLGKGFILKEYSGQKLMITINHKDWQQKNQWNNNLNFNYTNETKIINGFTCKKATAITQSGNPFTVYYAPDIKITNTKYNNAFPRLPGLPVQFDLQSGNLIFQYQLTSINYGVVPANIFEAPKSGYRVMSYEENQQLRKTNESIGF